MIKNNNNNKSLQHNLVLNKTDLSDGRPQVVTAYFK